jgi:hypothetical protein
VLSALLCLDPFPHGRLLPLPNVVLHLLYPTFKNFSRFGSLFSLCISLLAALGFSRAALSWGLTRKTAVFAAVLTVAAFESYCPTRPRVYDASLVPEEVHWLAMRSAPGIVAEYPMITRRHKYEPLYLTWQMHHGHPLVNKDYQGIGEEGHQRQVADYRDPAVVRRLAGWGVRYLLIHEYLDLRDRDPGREGSALLSRERLPARIGPAVRVFENPFASVFEIR